MSKIVTNFVRTTVGVLGIGLLLCARVNAQMCLGDCNGNGSVTAGELTKIIAIIGLCDSMATGCGAVAGGCVNADKNGNGTISAGELTNIISNILNFPPSGCPPAGTPGATNTPAATNTPPPVNTPTRTFTIPPSPTPTPTALALAVCGNGVKEGDEDCDNGGICIGGSNAGRPCTAEDQCMGNGVCVGGPHVGSGCADSSTCGSGQCLHCVPQGGDGCAANCTTETDVTTNFVPGVQVKQCNGGPNAGMTCTSNTLCGTGFVCTPLVKPGTSGSFVHDGIIQLPIPLSGSQVVTAGRLRNGILPFVVKGTTLKIPQIKVGTLACACVRGVPPKTCGGTLFDADGQTFTTNCTPDYTAGDSLCAGKNPCTFVLGAGNSSAGTINCNGLDGANLTFTQESALSPPYPPPGTPPIGSKPPVITLTGQGPPGSGITINSAAIGTTTESHVAGDVCTGVPSSGTSCPGSSFGADCKFCTDDDPQSSRGTAAPLPQVTGNATAEIINSQASLQADHNIGPFTVTGNALDCSKLTTTPPQLSGQTFVGGFTNLNAPATNDIVVTNTFIAQ